MRWVMAAISKSLLSKHGLTRLRGDSQSPRIKNPWVKLQNELSRVREAIFQFESTGQQLKDLTPSSCCSTVADGLLEILLPNGS